jgi:hypothetical protein
MGDTSALGWFEMIFQRLAKEPERYREIAHFVYGVAREIDFHPAELDLDAELIAWGLARKGPNPYHERYPEEPEETTLYLGCDYGEYPPTWEELED